MPERFESVDDYFKKIREMVEAENAVDRQQRK